MSRIRSVHPSLFTDEAWVSCSPLARVLYIGLWTDADDQGLFEWKPLQIRMRLLPGDAADVPALLAEMVAVDLIAAIESDGKKLGAIRNFRRFQRPKKPNALFLLPPEWANYVGLPLGGEELDPDDAPPVRNQFSPSTEISPQMEDGGEKKKEEEAKASLSPGADDIRTAFEEWNGLARRLGLPVARTLDGGRRSRIRPRLADGGLAAWRQALAAVEASPLCRGDNERGWRADLDFVCQAKSWRKLLEGSYAPHAPGVSTPLRVVELDPAEQAARLRILEEMDAA